MDKCESRMTYIFLNIFLMQGKVYLNMVIKTSHKMEWKLNMFSKQKEMKMKKDQNAKTLNIVNDT